MLRVYNTLTRKKEPFEPVESGKVRMYACGPTVYDSPHIGHCRTYVSYDIIRRYLERLGYDVLYVMNITDVGHLTEDTGEDRIIKKAKERRVQPMEIADFYTREFLEAMDALKVRRPNIMPRATGHMIDMIEAIKILIEKGYAYESGGSVYYDVTKFKDYGKLARRSPEELKAGARVQVREEKKHPADFALWIKAPPEHLMKWPSPWSTGYPGWHTECSILSMKYLGETLDIHGGAIELSFPHHQNEIVQSEAITGKKFVKYWVHTGLLNLRGQKMSKSLGNIITVKEILEKYDPEVIRLYIASTHYRKPIEYQEADLEMAKERLDRLYTSMENLEEVVSTEDKGEDDEKLQEFTKKKRAEFEEAMDDDFSTPAALAALFEMAREVNRVASSHDAINQQVKEEVLKTFRDLGWVLGILQTKRVVFGEELVDELMELIAQIREALRDKKEWELTDRIRKGLREIGVQLEDTPEGPKWKLVRGTA